MKRTIHTNWLELSPIENILNEVCHGLDIKNFIDEIGFTHEELCILLGKISGSQLSSEHPEIKIIITFNDREIEIFKKAFEEIFKRIKEEEFQSRIGISIQKAFQLKEQFFTSLKLAGYSQKGQKQLFSKKLGEKLYFDKKKISDHFIWLMNWFYHHCNGKWEYENILEIDTLDNPGWAITITLYDTELFDKKLDSITIDYTENNWIHCSSENGVFKGFGGPLNLPEILQIFRKWAESD